MKKVIIIDCGPSFSEVSEQFGFAPEWIMRILEDAKCNFKWVKCYEGETLNNSEGDAWIITGSPHSVYDELDWMLDLENKIRNSKSFNMPILGICFGHQLIAKSYGGKVELNPEGWELGSFPIKLTEKGAQSRIFSGVSDDAIVYQSHKDCVIRLPDGAIELAQNKKGTQSFKIYNNIYGVQFHPEFSWDIIKKYVSVRNAAGVITEDSFVCKSNGGQVVLHNFIGLIL